MNAARDQIPLAGIRLSTEHLRSPQGRVTPMPTWGDSVYSERDIHYKDDHDRKENSPDIHDALTNSPGDNLSNVLGNNPSELEHTGQSEIASRQTMME